MFSVTAEIYDAIYGFKDYAGEAVKIRQLITRERPGARTILDIACGTGEHARLLSPDFEVDGIDLEPKFVEIARAKNPAGNFSVADMRAFQLEKRYDVVQCLFGSIGYLLTPEDIIATLKCFRSHLTHGGVILVEPWLSPAAYKVGQLHMVTVDKPDLKLCRMNVSKREGDISILHFHYLIATNEGVRKAEEVHRLALVPIEQMVAHFEAAGLRCSFDSVGLFDRGLFIANGLVSRQTEVIFPASRPFINCFRMAVHACHMSDQVSKKSPGTKLHVVRRRSPRERSSFRSPTNMARRPWLEAQTPEPLRDLLPGIPLDTIRRSRGCPRRAPSRRQS